MIGRAANLKLGLIALWCVAGAGCGDVRNDPTEHAVTAEPVPTAASAPAPAAPAAPVAPVAPVARVAPAPATMAASGAEPSATAPSAIAAAPAVSAPDSIDETSVAPGPPPALPTAPAAEVAVAAAEPPVVAPAPQVTQVSEAPSVSPSSVALSRSAETLDFKSLVTRLRKTKAINLRAKVAVKQQSDDLLERFRAYHTQHGTTTLADLRRSYDLLFHDLQSLLQDADPPLARDIDRSRAAIWDVLADPRKFSMSVLMAGA
jgi:hypothetical protein